MKRTNGYGKLLGAGALGGAAIVLGAAALSAISGDTVRNDTSAGMASGTAGAAEANPEADPGAREFGAVVTNAVQWEDVQLATDLAPFEDDRVWSGERYRLPGEAVATPQIEAAPTPELPPPPAFQVLGTAAATGGGLAVLRVGDGTPQLVTPGQRVEGYEVASIDGGRVVMRNADRSISLTVASASQTGSQGERNARPGQTRNQGNANGQGNANRTAAVRQEMIMRQVEQLSEAFGPDTRVQVNGSEVTISGPNGQRMLVDMEAVGQQPRPSRPEAMPAQRVR